MQSQLLVVDLAKLRRRPSRAAGDEILEKHTQLRFEPHVFIVPAARRICTVVERGCRGYPSTCTTTSAERPGRIAAPGGLDQVILTGTRWTTLTSCRWRWRMGSSRTARPGGGRHGVDHAVEGLTRVGVDLDVDRIAGFHPANLALVEVGDHVARLLG
jgi:hypothetical protein